MTLHLHNIAPAELDETARHHPAMAIIIDIIQQSANLPPDMVAQHIITALISAELLKQEQFYV